MEKREINIDQSTITVIHQNETDIIFLIDMTASFPGKLIGEYTNR